MTHRGGHRVFLPVDSSSVAIGVTIELDRNQSLHLARSLRALAGEHITLACSDSNCFEAVIVTTEPAVVVKPLTALQGTSLRGRVSTVIIGTPKGSKADLICEKLSELDVRTVIFWQSAHSIVRLKPTEAATRAERLMRVAEAAAKQCGRNDVVSIRFACTPDEITREIAALPPARFVLSLSVDAKPLSALTPQKDCCIAVGPEGDFSPEELTQLQSLKFLPLSLGPLTLRCETAAIAGVAAIHGAWGFTTAA